MLVEGWGLWCCVRYLPCVVVIPRRGRVWKGSSRYLFASSGSPDQVEGRCLSGHS